MCFVVPDVPAVVKVGAGEAQGLWQACGCEELTSSMPTQGCMHIPVCKHRARALYGAS